MQRIHCYLILATFLFPSLQLEAQNSGTLSKPNHQQQKTERKKKASDNAINVKSFNVVWQTIKDSHWQPEKVGADWDKAREELYPRIVAAKSIQESRDIMSELIGRLNQSHFGLIPADSYSVIEDEDVGGNSDVGLTVRLVENQLVVTAVRPESSAASAGVQPGWSILKIRDKEAGNLISKIAKVDKGPQRSDTTIGMAMQNYCSGSTDSAIAFEFTNNNNQLVRLELPCKKAPGKYTKFGNLPAIRVADKASTLEADIGYYHFSAFLDPIRIMPAYRKAVRDAQHSGGMVIDLRGNIGGIAAMTMGMAGEFVTEKRKLGTLMMKGTELDFFANPMPKPYPAPVAVIVDECSISSAEIFAGGLKDLGLARIFGRRTAGLALPSTVIKLPNGDGFQYAFADYHSANGQTLEVNGVIPDENIELTRQNLKDESDPALRAAVHWILSKNSG